MIKIFILESLELQKIEGFSLYSLYSLYNIFFHARARLLQKISDTIIGLERDNFQFVVLILCMIIANCKILLTFLPYFSVYIF